MTGAEVAAYGHEIVRRYLLLARAEFRRQSTYRLALIAGVFTNTVFGFLRISALFAAVRGGGGSIGGYDFEQASTYVWLGQAFMAPVYMFLWEDIAVRVRTGEVAIDLARPIDLQTSYWARDLGRAALQFLTRGVPILILGGLLVGLAVPSSPWAYPLGLVSLLLGISISFVCRFGMNLIAFWTVDARGFLLLYGFVMNVLSGFFLPVGIFPGWLRTIAEASPFPAMFQTPIDITSGRASDFAALSAIGVQLAWLVALLVLTRLIMSRASRRLVVQGG